VEIDPAGNISLIIGKQGERPDQPQKNEWDEDYGTNQAEVRLPAAK
jgi:hypothetical protein